MILELFQFSYLNLFQNVNLKIEQNGCYLLYGKSGSGKTTFFHVLSNLITNYQGEVLIDGHSIKNRYTFDSHLFYGGQMSIVFQNDYLIDHLSLEEQFHLYGFDLQSISEILERLDLSHLKKTKIGKLSLGQKQRTMLALSYLSNAELILLDEPTAALDKDHLQKCLDLIAELSKKAIVIVATHQKEYYQQIGEGILEIKDQNIHFIQKKMPYRLDSYFDPIKINKKHKRRLHLSHLKDHFIAYLKLLFSFLILLVLLLVFFHIDASFHYLIAQRQADFLDASILYVGDVEQKDLLKINFDDMFDKARSDQYNLTIDTKGMVSKGKVIISKDLNKKVGDLVYLQNQFFQVEKIIDSPFIFQTIYLHIEDYKQLPEKADGQVLLFQQVSSIKEARDIIERKYFGRVENSYLDFKQNISSIQKAYDELSYFFLGYCIVFLIILFILTVLSLLENYSKEMINLYLHGLTKTKCICFYLSEIISLLLLAVLIIAASYQSIFKIVESIIEKHFTSYPFLLPISLFFQTKYLWILCFLLCMFMLSGMIGYLGLGSYFKKSLSKLVKENEGC